jgi:hypothetical protein
MAKMMHASRASLNRLWDETDTSLKINNAYPDRGKRFLFYDCES